MDPRTQQPRLEAVVQTALDAARQAGAEHAEAAASLDQGLSVTVRLGELESVERQGDRALAITVYRDGRKGSASTSDFADAAVSEVCRRAIGIAGYTEADPYAGLADPQRMAADPPDLDLYHPADLSVEEAEGMAREAETAARERDSRVINSDGATSSSAAAVRVYGNSHGFLGGYATTSHSLSCAIVAEQGSSMERDYWYTVARNREDLMAAATVGERASDRALRRLGGRPIATRHVPVVFPPELARGLIGHLVAAVRGGSQYRKASFLLDAAGEQIFPPNINMGEQPLIRGAIGSAPFDQEGVATEDRGLITDGVLERYVLSSYSARRLGLETTANAGGVHNLIVEPTMDGGLGEILSGLDEGFLVGELMGQGVNTVTGDYSRGAAGFWIESGEIAFPVNEVTIAGNLREMFAGVQAVGRDVDRRGTVQVGSVLIGELTVAGGASG